MTPLETLLIFIFVVIVIILLYSYLQNNRNLDIRRVRTDATNLGGKVYDEASNLGEKVQVGASNLGEKMSGEDSMSGMSEKINVSGVTEKVSGVGESLSGMGEKIKDKVGSSNSADDLNDRIDQFLNEQSDRIIKDWELSTKKDLGDLEQKYSKVAKDLGKLKNNFDDHSKKTDEKIKTIEERLDKLENPEE
jgi:hypothetical protein